MSAARASGRRLELLEAERLRVKALTAEELAAEVLVEVPVQGDPAAPKVSRRLIDLLSAVVEAPFRYASALSAQACAELPELEQADRWDATRRLRGLLLDLNSACWTMGSARDMAGDYADQCFDEAMEAFKRLAVELAPYAARPAAEVVAAFNAEHSVGAPVRYWAGARGDGPGRVGRLKALASVLPSGGPVAWIDTAPGCIGLSHVEAIAEDEHAAGLRQDVSRRDTASIFVRIGMDRMQAAIDAARTDLYDNADLLRHAIGLLSDSLNYLDIVGRPPQPTTPDSTTEA